METRIEWLSESCTDSVQMGPFIRKDLKKGQNTRRPVQIHSDRTSGCFIHELRPGVVMTKASSMIPAPRLFIFPQREFIWGVSCPLYTFVCHSNISTSTLDLPVMPTGQTLFTQHLIVLKSVWMIRIWLLPCNICCLFVLFCQNYIQTCCVGVQCQITGICNQDRGKV